MSDMLHRTIDGGVTLTIDGGELVIEVHPDKLTAAREIEGMPGVKVYSVKISTLETWGRRAMKRLRRWFSSTSPRT